MLSMKCIPIGGCRLLAAALCVHATIACSVGSTVVDLGYAVHKPSVIQTSSSCGGYYNFSNIRYAAPPLDSLRFKGPQPPLVNRSAGVQDGSYGNICPQAFPEWLGTALQTNDVHYYDGIGNGQTEAEDCLFLDVIVPRAVFHGGHRHLKPVVVWIYGGGYVSGDKTSLTNPIGLLDRAQQNVVFVAFNYRLGAFGWLAGPDFRSQGGDSNVGLLDQRYALEWVRHHIHLFGGDPERVTVMGESAGAGSILNHLVANNTPPLFQQVIAQSPIILPRPKTKDQDDNFHSFLDLANVTSLEEARKLPSEVLMDASQAAMGAAYYGSYVFGPAVDGPYVTDLPNHLMDKIPRQVKAFVGHNSHEGQLFVDPSIATEDAFNQYLSEDVLSYLTPASIKHVIQNLYPPVYDGSQPYRALQDRLALLISEAFIGCAAYSLANSPTIKSYGYEFAVPPGLHGQDIAYTFFDDASKSPFVENATVAIALQNYLTSFIRTGDPNGLGAAKMLEVPEYRSGHKIVQISEEGVKSVVDDMANKRCRWWQQNL